MLVNMDLYQLTDYIQKCRGYELEEAECLADFFYERGWDSIDVDNYLDNSNFQVLPPDSDVDSIIKKEGRIDYTLFKAFNDYVYLEFY